MLLKLAWGNVRKSVGDFGIYFLTIMLGVAVFYAFNSMAAQQGVLAFSETQDRMFELLGTVVGGVSVFIAFVLAFLVVYANRFLVRRRKKEFGLYVMLGMTVRDVMRILALETLALGAASLVAGLVAGIGLSQALLYLTSLLFQAKVATASGIAFVFSGDALAQTVVVCAVIFVAAALLNARTVARAHPIDLLHAESAHEHIPLRSLPLSLLLFAAAVALIGTSYKLLIDNGLMSMSPEFLAATAMVCVGTVLFFYSLSGFLLKLVQMIRPLYLRGLNMFTLRQLSAKVNTMFASLSVVCLALFLAITSVCGGIGIRNALEGSIKASTGYRASVTTVFGSYNAETGYVPQDWGPYGAFAQTCDGDMERGLRESAYKIGAGDMSALVSGTAQVDQLVDVQDSLVMGKVEQAGNLKLSDFAGSAINASYEKYPVYLARLSQVDAALELAGKPAVKLQAGECAVFSDSPVTAGFYRAVVDGRTKLSIGGAELTMTQYCNDSLLTTPVPLNTGTIVVPDEVIPADAVVVQSVLDLQCPTDESEAALGSLLQSVADTTQPDTWPVTLEMTRTDVLDQGVGLSTVVAYLAIYLGFVLVVACAAILAIQQLSDAADQTRRYGLLRRLGAPESMIGSSLFLQVLVCFLFPVVLAAAHAACALAVVTDAVAVFGYMDIGPVALTCAIGFLIVYGTYFAVTYGGARRLVRG